MDNKEIELKFVISKEKRNEILNDVSTFAEFVNEKHQIDTYYIPNFKSFEIGGETKECLRIREVGEKTVLCYKNIHRDANPVYCDEFETKVESKTETEKILFALGFSVQMMIDKIRKAYSYQNFEIDFDSVNDKIEFLEVELKDNNASVETILNFVSKYGLTKEDVTHEGIQKIVQRLDK